MKNYKFTINVKNEYFYLNEWLLHFREYGNNDNLTFEATFQALHESEIPEGFALTINSFCKKLELYKLYIYVHFNKKIMNEFLNIINYIKMGKFNTNILYNGLDKLDDFCNKQNIRLIM